MPNVILGHFNMLEVILGAFYYAESHFWGHIIMLIAIFGHVGILNVILVRIIMPNVILEHVIFHSAACHVANLTNLWMKPLLIKTFGLTEAD
jgi:hypothetical protein